MHVNMIISEPAIKMIKLKRYGGRVGSPAKGVRQGGCQRSRLAAATFVNHVILHVCSLKRI